MEKNHSRDMGFSTFNICLHSLTIIHIINFSCNLYAKEIKCKFNKNISILNLY